MPRKTRWVPFSYSNSDVRVFNCNEIFFENLDETQSAFINDIYELKPNKTVRLRDQWKETDKTGYKIVINGTKPVQGWYKMDEGAYLLEQQELEAFANAPTPERRHFEKQYSRNRGIFNRSLREKSLNMDIRTIRK